MLGIVQGATELLPISSSGHLILVPWLVDWTYLETHDEFNQTFDVALHLGTLVAVVAYFWHDLARLLAAWLRSVRRRRDRDHGRANRLVRRRSRRCRRAIVGAAGESVIADQLGEPWQIAIFLAFFGVVLWIADRSPQERGHRRPALWAGARAGLRAGACAHAGRLAFGDHDHSRPLPEARPRLGRAALVPAPRPDRARRGPVQGRERRGVRRPAAGLGWPVRRRHARSRREPGSSRSTSCSGTCGATTTRCSWSTGWCSRSSSWG